MIDIQELKVAIGGGDAAKIAALMKQYDLKLVDGKITANKPTITLYYEYWDRRQLVKKISLNSAYGALLNSFSRYYSKSIGQSVTLSGRTIEKHQAAYINEIITGKYQHDGDAVKYCDTDSVYFSAYDELKPLIDSGEMEWNKDIAVQLYDSIGDQVNASFPSFMNKAFHVTKKSGEIIKAGRELVGDTALFIKKKRYAINIYDKEGKRKDLDGSMGEIKAMGLDLKRSDTPKYVQDFLMNILKMVLYGKTKEDIIEEVKTFKRQMQTQPAWTKGSPKSVSNLTTYTNKELNSKTGKANLPGHVRGSMNWNTMRRLNDDRYSMEITDGMRIIVCKLKSNPMGYTSISYPADESRLPEWFKALPFDEADMENILTNEKLDNLLGVLGWDLANDTNINSTFDELFSFD
jgi:DNA polymerase elongation subunit (family B)